MRGDAFESLVSALRAARKLPTQWERSYRMEALRPFVLKLTADQMSRLRRRLRVPREESISSWVVGRLVQRMLF